MASGLRDTVIKLVVVLIFYISLSQIQGVQSACQFPENYAGSWYHRDKGMDTELLIDSKSGKWGQRECMDIRLHPNKVSNEGHNATILLKTEGANCYICMDVIYRSNRILQYRGEECRTVRDINLCSGFEKLPSHTMLITMFKMEIATTDCISSIEGLYQFSYEVTKSGGGICNNSESTLEACQKPGSPNYDNMNLIMRYRACKDNGNDDIFRFKCMGTWTANVGRNMYTFVALAHDETGNIQDRYKCLMTLKDQHSEDNSIRWGFSRFGDCRNLISLEQSPVKIVLRRKAPKTQYMIPKCWLPRNLTGIWFTQGKQFASQVWINDSHIHYRTKNSQYDFEDTWYSCQAKRGTRYLMTKEVVGRCEVNFVCYDIMPRAQGIARYRVGRPLTLPYKDSSLWKDQDFIRTSFRQACSWQWITFQRDNADWKYEVLIQNPPTPVTCPIGGRYSFTQESDDELQKYDTRIRGLTIRPRTKVNCLKSISEFKSCDADRTRMEVDAAYCETLDYRGKPIGEYEEPDHTLTCVGYWLEDMKSYLITYDEEDAVSKFRCWVYERTSWISIAMSRAETARCSRDQTSRSHQIDGVRFRVELTEKERLFDDCPQRFFSGIDAGTKPLTIYLMDDSNASKMNSNIFLLPFIILACFFLH